MRHLWISLLVSVAAAPSNDSETSAAFQKSSCIRKGGTGNDIPVIDIQSLVHDSYPGRASAVAQIGEALRYTGFFYVKNHGVSLEMQDKLEAQSRAFFAHSSDEDKHQLHMRNGGKAWRGYFRVGDELTSGVVDQKEGFYFGVDGPETGVPLHGRNLYPRYTLAGQSTVDMQEVVDAYMLAMKRLAQVLLRAVYESLQLTGQKGGKEAAPVFEFESPTELFRIFNYPRHDPQYGEGSQAVGEHTDYGYITILKQDDSGGLQVRSLEGHWVEARPLSNTFIINIGDALERVTGGLLRATPHKVAKRVAAQTPRLSFPYFYDPGFADEMTSIESRLRPCDRSLAESNRERHKIRWDSVDPNKFRGSYGDYLLRKVGKVFPELAAQELDDGMF